MRVSKKNLTQFALFLGMFTTSLHASEMEKTKDLKVVAVIAENVALTLSTQHIKKSIAAPSQDLPEQVLGTVEVTMQNSAQMPCAVRVSDNNMVSKNSFVAKHDTVDKCNLLIQTSTNKDPVTGKGTSTKSLLVRSGILRIKQQDVIFKDEKSVVTFSAQYDPSFNVIPGNYNTKVSFYWEGL